MTREESIKQIKTLIEAWKLDEADLNQTDINAMQVLLKENQDLKKQLENKYEKVGTLTSELLYEENTKLINQQKEFINYLQKEINQYTTHIEAIDSVCTSIYSSDYDNSKIKLAIYKEILQKYKEIIQTKNNNSV